MQAIDLDAAFRRITTYWDPHVAGELNGQQVRLVAQVGALTVEALGTALQSGQVGDTIKARNVTSERIVTGRLIDANTVEVIPGGVR